MMFNVSRTIGSIEDKPCNEAVPYVWQYVRVSDGQTYDRNGWIVEINTLDELYDFIMRYGGRIVIENDDGCGRYIKDNFMRLEIYDGYRE